MKMEATKVATRKQAAEVLGLTPQKFDYWQRALKIKPLKIGYNNVLYTESHLVEMQLALLLKERNFSKNHLQNILECIGESIIIFSELFLVKSPVLLDSTTIPEINPRQYLLTKEEIKKFSLLMVEEFITKGYSTELSIEPLTNIQEITDQIRQKMQQIKNDALSA